MNLERCLILTKTITCGFTGWRLAALVVYSNHRSLQMNGFLRPALEHGSLDQHRGGQLGTVQRLGLFPVAHTGIRVDVHC